MSVRRATLLRAMAVVVVVVATVCSCSGEGASESSGWRSLPVEGLSVPGEILTIDWIDNGRWLISSIEPQAVNARLFEVPVMRDADRFVVGSPREIVIVGDTCVQSSRGYEARVVASDTFVMTRFCNGNRGELLFVSMTTGSIDRTVAVGGWWVSVASAEPNGFVGVLGECPRIVRLTPEGSKRIDTWVRTGDLHWNLEDHSCSDEVGRAEFPSVLPSGGVAFSASARYLPLTEDQPPETLFIWDGSSTDAVAWRRQVSIVGVPVVAHRSDTIALSIGNDDASRTELIRGPKDHKTIYKGPLVAQAWSPDDTMLILHDQARTEVLVRHNAP